MSAQKESLAITVERHFSLNLLTKILVRSFVLEMDIRLLPNFNMIIFHTHLTKGYVSKDVL